LKVEDAREKCKEVVDQVKNVIVGKEPVLEKVMLAILANSHILFEDYPEDLAGAKLRDEHGL